MVSFHQKKKKGSIILDLDPYSNRVISCINCLFNVYNKRRNIILVQKGKYPYAFLFSLHNIITTII